MSNKQDLISMTKIERLTVVLESYGRDPERRKLADAGLEKLRRKEMTSAAKRRQGPFVVMEVAVARVLGEEVVSHRFLGEDFLKGSMERLWTDAYRARHFNSYSDAEKAVKFKGKGEIIPVSEMPVQANALERSPIGVVLF